LPFGYRSVAVAEQCGNCKAVNGKGLRKLFGYRAERSNARQGFWKDRAMGNGPQKFWMVFNSSAGAPRARQSTLEKAQGEAQRLAAEVGKLLDGCTWVGVPFAGGMCELAYIYARTLMVNDLHSHVINLAQIMASPLTGPALYRRVRRIPFHPVSLAVAQDCCKLMDRCPQDVLDVDDRINWAIDYFVASWQRRHEDGGTEREFEVGMSKRWNANGGDSAKHYWSAVESMNAWRRVLRRANFTVMDFRAFLAKCQDVEGHGLYCDPPFPGPGEKYRHTMSTSDHRELATIMAAYTRTRVVMRFYDVPLVRELYPEPAWTWRHLVGRKQTNDKAPEVLIYNRGTE
jgi:DNA adenine methylase